MLLNLSGAKPPVVKNSSGREDGSMWKMKSPEAFAHTTAKVGVLSTSPHELQATWSRQQLQEPCGWGEMALQRDAQETCISSSLS